MTTATPTSNGVRPVVEGAASGLPDEATLARLANAFFQMLPGEAEGALPQPPANPPAAPEPILLTGLATPHLTPADVTPTGVPESLAERAPADEGRVGGLALGVPAAYAAALPLVDATPVSAPTSPYYFLGEASAYRPQAAQARSGPALDDRVTARPFSLPGAGDLRTLLAGIELGYARDAVPAPPAAAPGAHPQFYFLDPAGAAAGEVPAVPHSAHPPFDVHAIRRDFPILSERVHGRPLVWLDNAATTQKPQAVIDRLAWFYAHENSNIHRAAHELAARATDAYEGARARVARFLGAASPEEIVFVRGATEGVNLVAQTFGQQHIGAGDEIVLSLLEHHANIVPWQQVAAEKGAKIRVIPVDDHGQLLLEEYRKLLTDRTRLVAITQVSNALGTVTPVQEIVALAHSVGARVLVDGAQAVSHMRVNVQALDADF
ncbi:MAG: aminotransferase class V-fold PLP-dependent enzyme [Chloroflexales bacterium]|nr:aminotransferase class V-fold PLP-dependent enzyme [Chloroflexales bacterium]